MEQSSRFAEVRRNQLARPLVSAERRSLAALAFFEHDGVTVAFEREPRAEPASVQRGRRRAELRRFPTEVEHELPQLAHEERALVGMTPARELQLEVASLPLRDGVPLRAVRARFDTAVQRSDEGAIREGRVRCAHGGARSFRRKHRSTQISRERSPRFS